MAADFDPPGAGHNSKASQPGAIIAMPVAGLTQHPSDPRTYNRDERAKARAILRRIGAMPIPLIVDDEGHVLAGWQALMAARDLGIAMLPAIRMEGLSGPKARELGLALNRFLELGSFDRRKLGALVLELEAQIPDFSVSEIGLDVTEVDLAIGALDGDGGDDAVPQLALTPITLPGGIWLCGPHRIGQGDACDPAALVRLTKGQPVDMFVADPPYGCKVGGFVTTREHREFVSMSGEQSSAELSTFFTGFGKAALSVLRPGALAYIFIDWRSLHPLLDASSTLFGPLLNLLVWAKDRPGLGSFYRSQHELVLVHRAPGGKHDNNVAFGAHGRNRSNVLAYPSALTFSKNGPEGDLLNAHPTPKNVDLVMDLILDCTARGGFVFDPFLGSGTTLIACERSGRVCHGLDLDPLYVDVAVRRWQAWTGDTATLEGSGESFAEREHSTFTDGAAMETIHDA